MLEIKDVSFSYDKEQVLDNISATFYAQKIYGILGANGAGKTTLFRLIDGINVPSSGKIRFQYNSISSSQVAYLETENYFYPHMKGREYLDLLSHNNANFNISLWNNIFKLPLDEVIDTYSTGMQKKLALFGILSLDRPILLLDEPFNGLDLEAVEKFNRILEELKKTGKIVIVASHILQVLKTNCNEIKFLHQGKVQRTFERSDFNQIKEIIQETLLQDSESILRKIFNE